MAFYASKFVYDSIPSSEYGLIMSSDDGEQSSSAGARVELHLQEIYRRPIPYLLGVSSSPNLEIPINIRTLGELSAEESSVISNWLFGQMDYKKLQILQPDMQYIYFNCIINDPSVIRVGNIIRGYTATIVCDSPFAWEYPLTKTYSFGAYGYAVDNNIVINNQSDNPDYTYPEVSFTMNSFGGDLSIINTSDSNREFLFEGLNPNEEVTVDNDLQKITSSVSGANRLSSFSGYKWLRFVPKQNNLTISGNLSSISFTYQNARKIS